MAKLRVLIALALLPLAVPAAAQKQAPQPRFAVVSIIAHGPNFRPGPGGRGQPGPVFPGGKYIDHHTALYELVWFAYPNATVPNQTLTGLPPWAYSVVASFDFQAEAAPGTSPSIHQMRLMMRAVLADRFKLRFHTEQRVLPVYFLELAKGGPRHIVKAKPGALAGSVIFPMGPGKFAVRAQAASIRDFAIKLGAYLLNRPVVDRTGLAGLYAINVTERSPRPPHARPGWMRGVILRGLRNGLGLKLVAGKAPVPVMIVDHVQRPSKN